MRAAALVVAIILSSASVARAQGVPPPTVPSLPDEPLPDWHPPPPHKAGHALFLSMSPEMQQAQKIRQAGLWISSIGWAQLLLGGILYAAAAEVNQDVGAPPPPNPPGVFNPSLEDERNRLQAATWTFLGVGGVMAAGGFVIYTLGQWKITTHHKAKPSEPLPPLSGF